MTTLEKLKSRWWIGVAAGLLLPGDDRRPGQRDDPDRPGQRLAQPDRPEGGHGPNRNRAGADTNALGFHLAVLC
jgi:hypothetical protein